MTDSNRPPFTLRELQSTASYEPSSGADDPGGAASARQANPHRSREARAFLALAAVRGVGQKTLFALAEAGRHFGDVLEHGPDTPGDDNGVSTRSEPPVSRRQWSAMRNSALARADELAERLGRAGVKLLFRGDAEFPAQLLELARPPHWLFVQGDAALLGRASVAIVGTRKPSEDGQFLTRYVGQCLADWGAPTVSGLAAGVDQLAHEVSLQAGVPTIAVLGTGILEDYPKGAAGLRCEILKRGGAVVSEYLPGISYSAENFVQRNRLQAALGRVLVPAEWQSRSGTAHTVRFATQLARPIACLRLPNWPAERIVLEPGLGGQTGAIFTVPREQRDFDRFVRDAIGDAPSRGAEQLTLFGED